MYQDKTYKNNLIVTVTVLSLLICGCDSSKQSEMTNAELERIAYAQNIELAETAGSPVLMVGGETVTSEEIIESPTQIGELYISPLDYFKPLAQLVNLEIFKERVREPLKNILTDKISQILLYQQAKRQLGENAEESLDKAAESELRKFLLQFGGDEAKADEELKKNHLDQNSFKERRKRALLIEWYVRSKFRDDRPITYRELMARYEKMKDEYFARKAMIQFRLIDIQPEKLKVTNPNEDRQKLAEKIANELLARLQAGEDFGELAKQSEYSHGHMKEFGGLWKPVSPDSLAPPYDVLAKEAKKTEPNQIKLIKTPKHIFIIKLEQKQAAGYEPFENVQEYVRKAVLIDRQNEVLDKLNAIVREQTDLGQTDEFIDFCLEKIHRMSNQ